MNTGFKGIFHVLLAFLTVTTISPLPRSVPLSLRFSRVLNIVKSDSALYLCKPSFPLFIGVIVAIMFVLGVVAALNASSLL
jgi:hypothetical protein